jgi:hypothetical protein
VDLDPLGIADERRPEDGAGLHPGDLGESHSQAATAVPKHRVGLAHGVDPALDLVDRGAQAIRQQAHVLRLLGQELV